MRALPCTTTKPRGFTSPREIARERSRVGCSRVQAARVTSGSSPTPTTTLSSSRAHERRASSAAGASARADFRSEVLQVRYDPCSGLLGKLTLLDPSSTRGNGLPDHPRTRGAGVDRTRRRTRARASLPHPRMVGESGARLSTASPAYHSQLTAYHSPSGPTYLLINRPGRPTYLFKSIGR